VNVDVLIAGAGPAGLAAGIELRRLGVSRVLIVDRETAAGGVPRHSAHTGYGLRDLRRLMTGPGYARHYVQAAVRAGAEVRTSTMVTAWSGLPTRPGSTAATGPSGPAGPTGATGPAGPTSSPGPAGAAVLTGLRPATLTSPDGIETVTAAAVLLATGCRERPRAARLVPGGRPPGVMTTGELQQRSTCAGSGCPAAPWSSAPST
jgi:thioredoxin reductase